MSTNDYTNAEKTKLASLENYDDEEVWEAIETLDETKQDKLEKYIEDATVSNDTLHIEKSDGSSIEFQGGGGVDYFEVTDGKLYVIWEDE